MDITTLFVFLTTFLLVYLNTRRPSSVPPGPNLWPLIGNLFCLVGDPLNNLSKLRSDYGDVIGLYLGGSLAVFVNGYEAVREVLVRRGSAYSWRPETTFTITNIAKGISFTNGRTWKYNRRFAMSTIHEMCFNRNHVGIESKVRKELSYFVDKLKSVTSPIDISDDIYLSIANVMCQVVFGIRPGYMDERLQRYIMDNNCFIEGFQRDQFLVDTIPFINWKPFGVSCKYERLNYRFRKYFESYDAEINNTYTKGNETCLAHYLMTDSKGDDCITWREAVDKTPSNWVMMHEFMSAGIESTSNTIYWILLHLIRQPLIQERAREEIDRVLGKIERPAISDRKRLPFLEAIIMEGLRIGQPFPLLPHSVEQNVTFRGFRIPKNTIVMVNLASVLRDSALFPDPEAFKPERFLSEDGNSVIVPDAFIPFSNGPRSCPGESLSRIELFLYMATLLQKFCFSCSDHEPMPEADGNMGIMYSPKRYKVKIVSRQL